MKQLFLSVIIVLSSSYALASQQPSNHNKAKTTQEKKERFQKKAQANPEVKKSVEECKQKVGFKVEKGQKPSKEMIDKMRTCMREKMGRKDPVKK